MPSNSSSNETVEREIRNLIQGTELGKNETAANTANIAASSMISKENPNAGTEDMCIKLYLKNGMYTCTNISIIKSHGKAFPKALGEQLIRELLSTHAVEEYVERDGKVVLNRKGSPGNWGSFSDIMVSDMPISKFGCIVLTKNNVDFRFYDNMNNMISRAVYVDDDIFSMTYTIISKESIREVIYTNSELERPLVTMGVKAIRVSGKDLNLVRYLNLAEVKEVNYSNSNLNLDNNLYEELNLNEMLKLFDFRTTQGRRYFSTNIRGPSRDICEIQRRQQVLFFFRNNNINREFPDLLRIVKKIERGKISVGEIIALCQVLEKKDSLLRDLVNTAKKCAERNIDIIKEDIIYPLQMLDFTFATKEIREKIDFASEKVKCFNDTMNELQLKGEEIIKSKKDEVQRISGILKNNFKEENFCIKIRRGDYSENMFRKNNFLEKSVLKSGVIFQTRTLNNLEREFECLRDLERKEEKIVINNLIVLLKDSLNSLSAFNTLIALVDYYCGLSDKLNDEEWCVPCVYDGESNETKANSHRFMAQDAFHPLVNNCIKNDISVSFTILTGPNTAGKSTFLKTIALTVILGQMGSLVPARNVKFELRDGIYIRSGASDRYGISTFMREMKDMARITNMCTQKSLILIDELGRGTSYIDGISLSIAIKEYLQTKNALAVFATHFTGKNEKMFLEGQNIELLCSEVVDGIITYKIRSGIADSLGIEVAKKVGFPQEVIATAERYLNE
ncbi:hypothetical protein VCUG_02338 [Vavraia culicis subsp. floridensis]|uniref:DNA mismatch repair proteins mutS family domain-containing protein n=1 Tax=Vavraia culicis (isolate floridensis) TaxID=948595 RepID=L2GRB0_VAVCU|nr:uncharacterized protein VCUG_02338 [Vavraia culicis subsp. floridensis]ELA46169.1 hypothetical protein VCUG_02338 [Vavraia culicis subsp. floridensis]